MEGDGDGEDNTERHETKHNRKNFEELVLSFSIDGIIIIFLLTVYTYT